MLCGKLPIVFLSTLASEKKDSTNSQIATYLLNHLDDIKDIGIQEMAKECSVAMSSISRFCKEIGLNDFNELRELLISIKMNFEQYSSSSKAKNRLEEYSLKVKESITMVEKSIDMQQINALCKEIQKCSDLCGWLSCRRLLYREQGRRPDNRRNDRNSYICLWFGL